MAMAALMKRQDQIGIGQGFVCEKSEKRCCKNIAFHRDFVIA